MIGTGWEIWGIKATMLLITAVAALIALMVRLLTHDTGRFAHVDGMAGDEGEE